MASLPGNSGYPPHVVSLPTGLSKPGSLNESRRVVYKAHLEALIKKVYSEKMSEGDDNSGIAGFEEPDSPGGDPRENPSLTATRAQLCGICKGGCCTHGASHAYISKATIERVKEALPDQSAEDILGEYMSRISDQTVEGSCINQTQTGCGLPRSLRSDICNNFFCGVVLMNPMKMKLPRS